MKKVILICLVLLVPLLFWAWPPNESSSRSEPQAHAAQFIGSRTCQSCHEKEHSDWLGSHHERSMQAAAAGNVRGAFDNRSLVHDGIESRFYEKANKYFVHTQGEDGEYADFEVAYTFGWYPLQQYLVAFPDGRVQVLRTSWDARPESEGGQKWFHMYPAEHIPPGDELHWTGRQQNWNFMCAECHTTQFRKNYDPSSRTFKSTWSEINVGCEACHGPGSDHLKWTEAQDSTPHRGFASPLVTEATKWDWDPKTRKPVSGNPKVSPTEVETCGRCHSRRNQFWEEVQHGEMLAQSHRVSILDEPLYFHDGQIKDEVFVYGSFAQSKMHQAGVRCTDCHFAHKTEMRFEGNLLCVRCHGDSDYGEAHTHHKAGTPGGHCVDCHMPERTYMMVDPRRDHRFGSPRPDVSKNIESPNACSTCHVDKHISWILEAFNKWYGPNLKSQEDHGVLIEDGRMGDPNAIPGLMVIAADPKIPAITRATALDVLSSFQSHQSIQVFVQSLGDRDALVRVQAIAGLEALPQSTRLKFIEPLLNDKIRLVRIEAARALGDIPSAQLTAETRGLFTTSLADYVKSQRLNADRDFAQFNLGLLYSRMGRHVEARAAYEEALRLNPKSLRAWVNYADLFRVAGDEKKCVEVIGRAQRDVGPQAVLEHALGLSFVRQERATEAIKAFKSAAQLEPHNPQRCLTLVAAYTWAGRVQSAYEALQGFLRRHPENVDVLKEAIRIHMDKNDPAGALPYAQQLLELLPTDERLKQLVKSLK